MSDAISRRSALAALLAPVLAAGCSFDSILAPERSRARMLSASSGADLTLLGMGDPHCKTNITASRQTGKLLASMLDADADAVAFCVGDLAEHGSEAEYALYQSVWGSFKQRTRFMMGNCDLLTDPSGGLYYDYVGDLGGERGKGYYAETHGSWRCYFLNSQLNRADQTEWLRADLPAYADYNIMAMWHQPTYASVCAHNGKAMTYMAGSGPWWTLLQQYGAEFVCSGHAHRYERFAQQLVDGTRSVRGIRQFILGTGGAKPMDILRVDPASEKQYVGRGAMRFDLYPDRYEWVFTDLSGVVRDAGTQLCRKAAA